MVSTAPLQAPPAQARTTNSTATPLQGLPGGFGDALTQALAPAGPAATAPSAQPGPSEAVQVQGPAAKAPPVPSNASAFPNANVAQPVHARALQSGTTAPFPGVPGRLDGALAQAPALPEPTATSTPATAASAAQPDPGSGPTGAVQGQPAPMARPVLPGKPAKDAPAAPKTGARTEARNKPAAEAGKPSDGPLPPQPLPVPPQATPVAAQPAATPPAAGDTPPPAGSDAAATAAVAGVGSRESPPCTADTAAQAAPPPHPDDAAPATAAGVDDREPPSIPATAQAVALPATARPPGAAFPSGASDTVAHAVQKRSSAVTAEKEPSAAVPAAPADAAPAPTTTSAAVQNTLPPPTALGIAPHPAPAPSQAPTRSPAADKPAPPPAAVQVGPALASFAAGAAHPGAPQHLTIRLDPLDLGRVQVRIERSPDGSARVELKVEKPDTLLLLLRDQPQLHRALDLAGVPTTERTLQFHLAPPDAAASNGMAAQSNADGGHGQHRPGQPHSGRFAAHAAHASNEPIPGPAAFRRAGVDITA